LKTCLVRFDNNKYSVASRAMGSPIEIQAYADPRPRNLAFVIATARQRYVRLPKNQVRT
jgi:hypothetical protein